jgi:nucleotide-binding universal stress UspA family protein
MKHYLVPYDGSDLSEAALKYAIQFAGSVPGVIDIVYIADERALANPVFDLTILALQGLGTVGDFIPREKARLELRAKLVAHGEELLEDLVKIPELSDQEKVKFSTRVEVDNPPKYLSDISENYDVLFLGLWGEMHKFKAGLWGGTSEAVIRRGVSPIFLATREFSPFSRIIIGFDNRPRSRQALAWAGMIGESMKIPVTLIVAGSDEKWVKGVVAEAHEINNSYDTSFTIRTIEKRAARGILDESKENPGSLICVGAFGDQPIRELFLGSVAEEVLRHSESPVMLFK